MTFDQLIDAEGRAQLVASFHDPDPDHVKLYQVLHWARVTIVEQRAEIEKLRDAWGFVVKFRDFMRGEK